MLYVNPVSPMLNRATAGSEEAKAAQQKMALQELEHMFLYSLMREMHQTVSVTGDKKSREMETFEEMLDDSLSGEMAKSGQIGVANQIEQQLAQLKARKVYADNKTEATPVQPARLEED